MEQPKPVIGVSCGDLNGISLEVIIKTFQESMMLDFCTPVLFASGKVVSYHRKAMGVRDFSFNIINKIDDVNPKRANLINLWEENISINLGKPSEDIGTKALESINAGCDALKSGKIDALVTGPINKNTIKIEGRNFSGHTDYLAEELGGEPLMILYSEFMKVALVTGHVPVSEVSKLLTEELILKKLDILNKSLIKDFGIRKPKIAVLGLNPHAGEEGLLGNEEKDVIIPAVAKANEKGVLAFGPYAADGFFGTGEQEKFDAVLAMYHDQGLVPFKALSFETGVNYTAGLDYVRTSPDHGTGYGIAGKNIASEGSFRNAVFEAIEIVNKRKEYAGLKAGALDAKVSQK